MSQALPLAGHWSALLHLEPVEVTLLAKWWPLPSRLAPPDAVIDTAANLSHLWLLRGQPASTGLQDVGNLVLRLCNVGLVARLIPQRLKPCGLVGGSVAGAKRPKMALPNYLHLMANLGLLAYFHFQFTCLSRSIKAATIFGPDA